MYLKRYATALFFISLFFVGCEPSVRDGLPYEEYVKMVQTYLNEGDYDRAIIAGNKLLSIKPTDGETHYFLATQYYEAYRINFEAAQMKGLRDAILNPNKRQPSDRMEELKKNGFRPELKTLAFQEFNKAVEYSPRNWFARYMVATDSFNNKHFTEAIDEYKKVIAINPNYANAHGLMGESYYKLGDFKSAVLSLETAVKLDPGVENYLHLGLAYKRTNDRKKYLAIAEKLKGLDKGRYDQLVSNLN